MSFVVPGPFVWHTSRTFSLQDVLRLAGHRDLRLYLSRIEQTSWINIPLEQ